MYSGFRHVTPCEVASETSTLKSPGLSRLKSAKRCVASLYRDGEGPGRTCKEMTDVCLLFVEADKRKPANNTILSPSAYCCDGYLPPSKTTAPSS